MSLQNKIVLNSLFCKKKPFLSEHKIQIEEIIEIDKLFKNLPSAKYIPKIHINVPKKDDIKNPYQLYVHVGSEEKSRIVISEEVLKSLSSEAYWLKLATEGIVSSSLKWCSRTLKTTCYKSSTANYKIEADQTKKGWFFITLPSVEIDFENSNEEVGKADQSVLIANLQNQLNDKGVKVDQVVLEKMDTGILHKTMFGIKNTFILMKRKQVCL